MIVLALETSCDETAAAILCEERGLLASEVSSQIDIHKAYGGVVPEVASRNHLLQIQPVIDAALSRAGIPISAIDAVAATAGPGLATSLMIGMSAAKGIALGLRKPFVAVNHIEGHLLSPFFNQTEVRKLVGLVVSGGHTLLVEITGVGHYRLLGQTRDDAAGEAFDKVGKLLGLPYPGGPEIDRRARQGDPKRFDFPRSMLDSGDFSFSFSGLKTAVRIFLSKLPSSVEVASGRLYEGVAWPIDDICASFQEAVVDVLVAKTLGAARATGCDAIAVSGGVSCNSRLREKMSAACRQAGMEVLMADPVLSTDNAAMIAFVALHRLREYTYSLLTADIDPNLRLV